VNDEGPPDQPPAPETGVFGNLPGSRPANRSPRRDRQAASAQAPKPRATGARREREPDAAAQGAPRREPSAESEDPDGRTDGAGLEDLAWAGVAVAAEAATLGVRLVSQAMGALRGPDDQR
jgi:hypothetical protein